MQATNPPSGSFPLRFSRLLGLRGSGLQQARPPGRPKGHQNTLWPGCCRAGKQEADPRQTASGLTGAAGQSSRSGVPAPLVTGRGEESARHLHRCHWGLAGGVVRNPSAACPFGSHWPGLRKARGVRPWPMGACGASGRCSPLHPGLIQSLSHGLLPGLSTWVEVGGIASSLCLKAPTPQPIST